jgi:hypothetical protein
MARGRHSYREAFQHISSTTRSIGSLRQVSIPTSTDQLVDSRLAVPALCLRIPDTSSIIDGAKCSSAACAIADAFSQSSHNLRELYESKHAELARFLASDPNNISTRLDFLRTFFENQYSDQMLSIERSAVARIQALQDTSDWGMRQKPVFNQVCALSPTCMTTY